MSEHRRVREIFENEKAAVRLERALGEGEPASAVGDRLPRPIHTATAQAAVDEHGPSPSPSVEILWIEGVPFEVETLPDGTKRLL